MKLIKCLRHAFAMVVHSKLRSWLTILGIVIGVAAVIAIVSISDGLKQNLTSSLGGLGGDIVTVTAGASRGGNSFGGARGNVQVGGGGGTASDKEIVLDRTDVQALKGVPEIAIIETEIRGNSKASYLGKTGTVSITGVDQKVWSKITTAKIKDGRFLDSADSNVIVIGGKLASSYFSQPVGINQMISINGSAFRVVGVLDDQSNSIYMPIQMAYSITGKEKDIYDSIIIKIANEDDLDNMILNIEEKLMISRHVVSNKKDFSVTSSKQLQETRAAALNSISTFLVAIAAVSLIVGAVGVANTMFTSVLEKTKEIGIMKAIGARNYDILLIFLFNAALIGLVGGILGAIFGTILSAFLPALTGGSLPGSGSTYVSTNSIVLALSVSTIIGIIAGTIPAYQGSKLKPVDALRYE